MAKLRKVKVQGLTEFDSLDLNIESLQHYNLSGPAEDFKELMSKLTEIVSKSKGAIISKPLQGRQHVAAVIRPSKQKKTAFSFPEPNLIHLYYDIAVDHLIAANQAKVEFQAAAHSPSDQEFDAFCVLFREIAQGIVFLLMSVEGFMNQLPADGVLYAINGEDKNQKDVEWMIFKEKLRYAVPAITGYDLYTNNRLSYDRIVLLNDLRDDLIHLKKISTENFALYQELFKRLYDFNSEEIADAVFNFINTVKPDYLQE